MFLAIGMAPGIQPVELVNKLIKVNNIFIDNPIISPIYGLLNMKGNT
jgi:hypothetical protein